MIRSEAEYQEARRRLDEDRKFAEYQRAELQKAGLKPDEVERGMAPLLSFQAQLEEEVAWYEDVKSGKLPAIRQLTQVGQLLIALRLAAGLSQRQLAERLGVSESQVSRDEKNEYHGISVDRAQKIIDALHASVETRVEEPPPAYDEMMLTRIQ